MARIPVRLFGSACAIGLAAGALGSTTPVLAHEDAAAAKHVLLLSVDGLHQTDLAWYVQHHPGSELAALAGSGAEFTNAQTPFPSDSFPGIVGQLTGGNPSSTGIYYDDSWNAALLPSKNDHPDCRTAKPGVEVQYFEAAAIDPSRLDSGQVTPVPGLPDGILALTRNATSLINPDTLPRDPKTCLPVYPHQYIQVNTVFEVAKAAGMRTAWTDKHAAYEVLNGPSGKGVMDFFTPEINSDSPVAGLDWTGDNALTQRYDSYKVHAILNQIDGFDHSRTTHWGVPAIFGMNFQTVSTAQKLPHSPPCPSSNLNCANPKGGYMADGVTPEAVLSGALDYINAQVGAMVAEIKQQQLDRSTTIILSAKHGQSPQTPSALTRIGDGAIIDALNAAWKHDMKTSADLVAFSINDDGMLIWLTDRSQGAADYAKRFLLHQSGTGNDILGNPKPYTQSGLRAVLAGEEAADFMKVQPGNPRVPDLIGIAQYGTVYTGKKKKISEHGGDSPQDRHVALVVSGAGAGDAQGVNDDPVETTQIAPTILKLLGLNPGSLRAVRIEHTRALDLG